jgi:CheY-like chemotaxis protein
MNVLLMDDDLFVLSMLQGALEKWGHKVDSYLNPEICPAYCAQECHCDIFEKGCPDVILTDVNMPLVDGFKFIEELKRKGCKCPKIGMMSGDWCDPDLLKAFHFGVKIFAKPFDLSKLQLWLSGNVRHVVFADGLLQSADPSFIGPTNPFYRVNVVP